MLPHGGVGDAEQPLGAVGSSELLLTIAGSFSLLLTVLWMLADGLPAPCSLAPCLASPPSP